MSIQVAAAGNGFSPVELTQERVSPQIKTEVKVFENAQEALPKYRNEPPPDIMADLEKITVAFNKKLKFEINHQSRDVMVKVIDPETDKVIKELPPKELQRLHSRLKETMGFLFDERI
ncbi:MAG: flagellar protein FlaG [Treponema sp.]|jgi:flagellar protein FlaG|nr:flagellar protein FlaG [Treponema sp.]